VEFVARFLLLFDFYRPEALDALFLGMGVAFVGVDF